MGLCELKRNKINLIWRGFELWWISMDHKLAVTGPAKTPLKGIQGSTP